jgi:transposase
MKHYIGIDVSKSCLDVHIRPEGIVMQFTNSPKGIDSLVEASGGYEKNVRTKLSEKGIDTSYALSRQSVRS